jgi:glycosyltransferase involved in cell wall biosynthesis
LSTEPSNIISIIIATYNRAHLIPDTLDSIINQTFQNFECLIIDDGSTDNTQSIIEHLLNQDNRFKFLKRPKEYKKGLPGCRNFGLDLCKGDYVIFFDDDDIMHPKNLEYCYSTLIDGKLSFCRFERQTFSEKFSGNMNQEEISLGLEIGKQHFFSIMTNRLPFNSCQVMWKRRCFEVHKFNENLMYAEEWECYLKIIFDGFKGVNLNNILMYARKHEASNTGEFFMGSELRKKSYSEAIIRIVEFLHMRNHLSLRIKKYLFNEYYQINGSFDVNQILKLRIKSIENFMWRVYFLSYSFRLKIFKLRKAFVG